MARRLGVTCVAVHYWRRGARHPREVSLLKIQKEYNLPVAWWYEKPTRAQRCAA